MRNKKNNRKGFTIVELVIVIAVIAILAAVMVPTFGNIIKDAKESAALQVARNELTNYMIDNAVEGSDNLIIMGDTDMYFAVVDGKLSDTVYDDTTAALGAFSSITNAVATQVENSTAVWTVASAQGGNT